MIDLAPYVPLARRIASRYFLAGSERDDLEQEALIGLWKAARDFNGEGPFEPFARLCIERQVITALKAARRFKHEPLTRSVRQVETDEGELRDVVELVAAPGADPAEIVAAREEARAVLQAIAEDLTPLERRVLIGFANGQSFREIHAEVGGPVSHHAHSGIERFKRVENALERARGKLADPFEIGRAA